MTLRSKGEHHYGDSQADLREELLGYSEANAYVAEHFADAVCGCGGRVFGLRLDDTEGAAVRVCRSCEREHPIGDSDEYLDDAELEAASASAAPVTSRSRPASHSTRAATT